MMYKTSVMQNETLAPTAGVRSSNRGNQRNTYTYQSGPVAPWIRTKYRPKDEGGIVGNIMTDRRICRGPAFHTHTVSATDVDTQANRQAEARRRAMARRKAQTHKTRQLKLRAGTPPPVEGRKHEDIQTEDYLEEIFYHPLEMAVTTQTDVHLDRPPTPPFIPQKIGMDASTQIYPGDIGQEFEVEVKPVVEVLVGKTIEQALVEVMEEDELAAIKEQQRRFKELRDAELAEDARVEEIERRKKEEMEMRMLEQESVMREQQDTQERIAAAVLTTGYLADLLPSVFSGLRDAGFNVDDIEEKVEDNFMTWLMNEVKTEMQRLVDNKDFLSGYSGVDTARTRATLEEMIRDIVQTRAEIYRAIGEKDNGKLGDSEEEPDVNPLLNAEGEYGDIENVPYAMKFGGDDESIDTELK